MTANEINALPPRVRRYIHDLEASCDPAGEVRELWAQRENAQGLSLMLTGAREELNEADRRAGAAERRLAYLQEEKNARTNWLDNAKREAGYDTNVSFDVVWEDALEALREKRERDGGDEEEG